MNSSERNTLGNQENMGKRLLKNTSFIAKAQCVAQCAGNPEFGESFQVLGELMYGRLGHGSYPTMTHDTLKFEKFKTSRS